MSSINFYSFPVLAIVFVTLLIVRVDDLNEDENQPICYELVWSDEFNGSSLDTTKWKYQRGAWNGSNVQNCYIDANTTVSNGSLQITGKYDNNYDCFGSAVDFTSGFVQTKDKMSWTFGYFEARVKVPASKSTWPAFWLSPQENTYGAWPRSGEIDVFEIKGHDMTTSYGNAHWGNASNDKKQAKGPYTIGNANDWHIYAVEWKLGELKFFIDGIHYHTISDFVEPNATSHPGPFNIPFYLRFNMAIGGDYLNSPYNDANNGINQLPATMEVDWVRVYQINEECSYDQLCEKVANGTFNGNTDSWHLQQFNSATGSTNLTNDGYIKVNITQASSQNWHLALRQNGLLLEQGKAYEVKYKVYADNPRSFNTIMSKKDGTQYHYQSGLASTTPENHSFQFAMTAPSDSDAIINFNLGADISSTYLDSISIIELNCDPCSNSLYLLNQNIYPRSYQVAQLLESNGLVKNGDTVNFRANEIQMSPNFEVNLNSLFTANNDPCQN